MVAKVGDCRFIKLHKGSLVSATSRSLLKLDQAHIAVGGRELISLMSVKLTRINRATGRRKESCEDPRRAPIAQEQHTSSTRFPQGA